MKTIVNKIELAKANDVTILHNTKKNQLTEVEYVRSIITLDGGVTHIFKSNGKDIEVYDAGTTFRMYQDKEHFEKEIPVDTTRLFLDCANTQDHYRISPTPGTDREKANMVAFSFVNGIPADVDAPVVLFEAVLHRGYISISTIFDKNVNLDEYFNSVENATTFHDYTLTDKEGNDQTVKGRCYYFIPTEEQKPVVEELKAVIEKMKQVGLGLLYNDECVSLHVYNCRQTDIVYDEEGTALNTVHLPKSLELENPIHCVNSDGYYQMRERYVEPEGV